MGALGDVMDRWNSLSPGMKVAVAGGGGLALVVVFMVAHRASGAATGTASGGTSTPIDGSAGAPDSLTTAIPATNGVNVAGTSSSGGTTSPGTTGSGTSNKPPITSKGTGTGNTKRPPTGHPNAPGTTKHIAETGKVTKVSHGHPAIAWHQAHPATAASQKAARQLGNQQDSGSGGRVALR